MSTDDVLMILAEEQAQRRKVRRVIMWVTFGILAICAVSLGFMIAKGKSDTSTIAMFAGLVPMIGLGVGFSPRAKSALKDVVERNDPATIGSFVEALGSGDRELVKLAESALSTMLPQQPVGSIALDSVQYQCLVQHLMTCEDSFALIAVRAMPAMARPEMIGPLKQLAEGKFLRTHRRSASLQVAAQSALPDVRMQLAREVVQKAVEEADRLRLAQTK